MTTYGLVGFPLGHSFSKGFFTEKFQKEGIDAEYLNFEIPHIDGLRQIIESHPTLKGLNVTLPHKQAVIPLLDELSEEARAIGAVNVIRVTKTPQGIRLKGFNTDTIGFTKSITPLIRPQHRKALVLGTGGASKAICYSLESMGIEWQYVSRTPRPGMLSYSEITQDIINDHTIIVNCTPVGMHPHTDACPPIPYEYLSDAHLVYDVVYNPLTTLFMQKAAAQGATTKNGLEMLHQQAIAAWEIWNAEK